MVTKITPELEARLQKNFRSYRCDTCDGYAVHSQSPSNPTGYPCEECNGNGFTMDGSTLNDLQTSILRTINDYVKEFAK